MRFGYYSRLVTLLFAILGVRKSTWYKITLPHDLSDTFIYALNLCGMTSKSTWVLNQLALVITLIFILRWQTESKKQYTPLDAIRKNVVTLSPLVLKCFTWLLFAGVAPFFFWPELEYFTKNIENEQTIALCKETEGTPSKRRKKIRKNKDKSTEMTGVYNKRMRVDLATYDRIKENINRSLGDLQFRAKNMQLKYASKKQQNESRMSDQSDLLAQSVRQKWQLQHELVLLENTITATHALLKSYKFQNKSLICQYEKIYKQTLSLERVC